MGSEQVTRTPESRRQFRQMLAIGAIATACGIALGLLIDWFPLQGSEEAKQIDTVYDVLVIASVPFFVLVMTVVGFSIWRFRMRPGQELEDGPPIHGNTRLEVIWTAIPAILLVGLCTYAYVTLDDIEEAKADSLNVRVVGEQFAWTFFYKDPAGGNKEIATTQLYLPERTPVKFDIQSKDVLHDFWVPAFRMKIDAVPGITTSYRITTRDKGTHQVVCAELCGLGHAVMRQTARVVPRGQFDAWLKKTAQGPAAGGGGGGAAGGGGGGADGKAVFTSQAEPACGACHTLADAGTNATTGPNLGEVLKGKDENFIRQSIENPDAEIAPGFQPGIMPPNYDETLKPEQLDALVDYLSRVTR